MRNAFLLAANWAVNDLRVFDDESQRMLRLKDWNMWRASSYGEWGLSWPQSSFIILGLMDGYGINEMLCISCDQ